MSEEPKAHASLGNKAASGVAWTIALTLLSRVASLVVNIFITRYVTPSDYGEVNGAAVLAGTAGAFSSFGLGAYLVSHPKEGRDVTWHVWFYGVTGCSLLMLVVIAGSDAFALGFKLPNVMRYLPFLAAAALIERSGLVMEKLMLREFRYRTLGLASGVSEATFAFTSLTLVLLGFGAMGIAWANVARAVVRFLIYWFNTNRSDWLVYAPLSWVTTKKLLRFGAPITIGGISDFIARRWDNMLTSRFFGAGLMGAYNIAYNLGEMPAEIIGERAGDALLPAFAHLPPEDRLRGLVRAIKLLSLIVFPISMGLAAVSESAVHAFFDPRWYAIGPMLSILCGISLTRPLTYSIAMYLQAIDRTRGGAFFEVSKTIGLLALMWLLGPLGPLWACAAVVIALTLHTFALLAYIGTHGTSVGRVMFAPVLPLLACVPMIASVLVTRQLVATYVSQVPLVSLALETIVGAIVFLVSALTIARPIALDLIGVARRMIGRRLGKPAQ